MCRNLFKKKAITGDPFIDSLNLSPAAKRVMRMEPEEYKHWITKASNHEIGRVTKELYLFHDCVVTAANKMIDILTFKNYKNE